MKEILDAASFKEMFLCANAALEENKQIINDLNVFPVPDGDTGTNMSLTMNSAAIALRQESFDEIGKASKCAANALLRGARGNSGVILSLLFRGISKSLKGKVTADAPEFAAALTAGVEAAYKAVMKPAEGTILTVSRMAAAAATEFAKDNADIELMFDCLLSAAKTALAETIHQNPVLERAGVVDAGGQGFVVVMDAMLAWLQGRAVAPVEAKLPEQEQKAAADFTEFDTDEIHFTYCTEFIAARESQKSPELLRTFLENIGDCVVVVSDEEIVKVHVHTNVPGEVLTEALTYGPLQTVKIENMRNQHTVLSKDTQPAEAEKPAVAPAEKPYGIVTVCAGDGMSEIFRELGADRVVTGGQTMNPSTEDILREVDQTPAETVFVLPNNKNIIMAAEQCARFTEKKVVVVPTRTVPQGIAALLNFDDSADADAIAATFMEAAQGVHTVAITYAARDSDFDGHDIHAGEYLALLDGALIGNYSDFATLLQSVVEAAESLEPEIISVYYGEDVQESDAQSTGAALGKAFPDADVNVVSGGQPVYYYMISLE